VVSDIVLKGSLFSTDFILSSITRLQDWHDISPNELTLFESDLKSIFAKFPTNQTPNESQTEEDLIWPVLNRLGWNASLRQQNLAAKGRNDVPDGLLFEDEATKATANLHPEEYKRYGHGLSIVESKRWQRPLDRQSGTRGEETAPSTQMLRYLRRVEDLTTGKLRWGILTDGAKWRLYFQGARSVSENFFELDLAAILGISGYDGGLFALSEPDRNHWLKVFLLIFRKTAFVPDSISKQNFHQRAIADGKFYEERVAASVSNLVFNESFPSLARAIANAAPDASLQEVREAVLVLLYRLLFILYAEDRDLLPVKDKRYDDYSLRNKVRSDVQRRKDAGDTFSQTAARYWSTIEDLCRAIDKGDASIGIPPYNGGLFDAERTPLLGEIKLGDAVMANVIDALSFEQIDGMRRYINYRDLSVQQLGSIYERLLEHEVKREGDDIIVRPNVFARKGSGSYYTPDELVALVIKETIDPLISAKMEAFEALSKKYELNAKTRDDDHLNDLKLEDPATLLLNLKICDPAMGSGHFLVSLVDYLADRIIACIAEAQSFVKWADYTSPLVERISNIRSTIFRNAQDNNWIVEREQLDDRHIVRRMILKRCVYGVDKNSMAVELAKVALWLHTFTVGAPLSFLDHHLRCGDSLFGSWVRSGTDRASSLGSPLFLHEPLSRATRAATSMQLIEGLTDAEIAEAHRSAHIYEEVVEMTAPLNMLLSLIYAFDWLRFKAKDDVIAIQGFLIGQYGDPIHIAIGKTNPLKKKYLGEEKPLKKHAEHFAALLEYARALIAQENFFHWQVAFPGVWKNWNSAELEGGFDAVIGNPPWDRMKLQQVEWFAARKPEIALTQRAADRTKMIKALEKAQDPLAADFAIANTHAETAVRIARDCGNYPLLSGGDTNLYSLFVERAMQLVKPTGIIGLLTPSGIASDKTAAPFFKAVATEGRLKALYDFENKKVFFPDVHASFKFCVFVASPKPFKNPALCAFYVRNVKELEDPNRCFTLTAADFAKFNPNTGTAPIFKTRRDADITSAIYSRLPVLVDKSSGVEVKQWPVKYFTMFHMTNDSNLFRTRKELEENEGAYPIGGNVFDSGNGQWLPLYEGKMVQAYDHRAASIVINSANLHRAAQPEPTTDKQHESVDWLPNPQFWIAKKELPIPHAKYFLGFKDITASTNMRSMIAALVPTSGLGNTLPSLVHENSEEVVDAPLACLLLANINALIFDFVTRQKIQAQHLNYYILEQLPVIPLTHFTQIKFGTKTAAEIIKAAVLELTYTAHDMADFALDLGYVDKKGNAKPPFIWDETRRLHLKAKLDAVFFNLYGITNRDDIRYIYSTFPIVEKQETETYGRYLSCDLCLAYMNALAAGNPNAVIKSF
jgi:hypothetical protein